MTSSPRLLIADIGPAHGIKGAVKLRLFLEDPDLLPKLGPLYIGENGDQTTKIKLIQDTGKSGWVAMIDGVTDRNGAEKWRGVKLYALRASLPDLTRDTGADNDNDNGHDDDDDDLSPYYVADLVDLTVYDADTGAAIGTVAGVDNFGASDLLDIKPTIGHTQFYIPFTDDYIVAVDVDAGQIRVQNYAVFADPSTPVEGDQS